MDEECNRVTVTICGEEYQLKSTASEEHVRQLAARVDERMRQIGAGNPRLGATRTAVLTAMTLADELQKKNDELERLTRQLEDEWMRRQRK